MSTTEHDNVRERIATIVEPLRGELDRIDREIRKHELALDELKNDRRVIVAIVSRADGTYKAPGIAKGTKRKTKSNPHAAKGGRWDDLVRDYLDRDGVPTDHIVATHIYRAIKRDAIAHGKGARGYPGAASVKSVLERMHAAGVLRRVGTGKGGHAIYATLNGAASDG